MSDDPFRDAVEAAARDLGFTVTRWLPAGVELTDTIGEMQVVHLVNLARRVKGTPPDDWPGMVRDFLAVATRAAPEVESLAGVAGRLRVRLGRPFRADAGQALPWQLPVGGTGLAVNLVVDADRHMSYVGPADIESSDAPAEYWLGVALDNLAASTLAGWLAEVHAASGIRAGNAGDAYDAARGLVLDRVAPAGPAGWFVAVPARDWLFALPVRAAALDHLGVLKAAADRTAAADAYPITDRVFWVRPGGPFGVWEAVDLTADPAGVRLDPSAELLAALEASP